MTGIIISFRSGSSDACKKNGVERTYAMNIRQIEYFLEIAKCKNISDAAENLFVTQPTLGRQMSAMESELNMQLFIRSNKGVKLTPAGAVMYQEFQALMDHYRRALKRGEMASYGYSGTLKIGILSGMEIGVEIQDMIHQMSEKYPNVRMELKHFSHGEMVHALNRGELDLGVSIDLAFMGMQNVRYVNLRQCDPVLILSRNHPLAKRETLSYRDLKNEELVVVKEGDCPAGEKLIVEECRKYGNFYPRLFYADSMEDAILWVESGLKCAIFNTEMSFIHSPLSKYYILEELKNKKSWIQAVYRRQNSNIALSLALEYLE